MVPTAPFVIPAKAGIHALTFRERTSTAIPPPTSTRRPHFVFPAKAHPEPRYGAGIQRGVGGANFHTLVCRRQPPSAIAMKACPGPRSGMMLRGLGCARIPRLLLSSFRPPIRHSGEGRNPEGRGGGNVVRSKTTRGEGLVPRWGGGGAWQNPPSQFAVPSHNSSFSYLGVPAPTGMSDWYENDVTRFR